MVTTPATIYKQQLVYIDIIMADSSLPLDQWPEPIVRVQSLSESASSTIPDKYVKPVSERPSLNPDHSVISVHDPTTIMPVVDLGGLSGSTAVREDTVRAISDACKEWGFFQVVNHGVSLEVMREVVQVWREFFHLPMETKQAYANSPTTLEGYGSRLGVQKDAILDWGDYYFLQLLPECIRNKRMMPTLPISLRGITEAYADELLKICKILMGALSLGLGLDETSLEEAFGREVGACMRVSYYPKCPQPELALGLSPHSDPGGLTILLPDHVKGLQVCMDGSWITVEPIANAFIINIGDQIQVLSNAIYKSVEHRVIVNSVEERLSIAFFYNPKGDKEIEPVKELVKENRPAQYKQMTFNEYRMHIRKFGPRGKALVESLKSGHIV